MPTTMTIRETLERDLNQRIEEIIKLDQQDERVVYQEITEYIPTPDIQRGYRELLEAYAESHTHPTEAVGVWVSGFFGSGKSSFAKNLGYMLANRTVRGEPAGQLLAKQLDDRRITERINYINSAMPTEVIMFDVMLDAAVRRGGSEPIAEIVYTVLLRHLDYAEDFTLAELEIELEGEDKLARFERAIAERYAADLDMPNATPHEVWRRVRRGARSLNRASYALHDIDPNSHPSPESYLHAVKDRPVEVSVREVVERSYELMARRRPGKGLVIIIDEVGQYVGRSHEKIESLRALVEQYGKEGRNRVERGAAPAPVWLVVTSQEKLDEVVAALDARRVELAKLQDRFHYRIDFRTEDIKTVATKRVLGKNHQGSDLLGGLFTQYQGALTTHVALERTTRAGTLTPGQFVQFYPYLPHFIDLSIDIVSGLRLQPGAPKHIGGSNRTIIKQAYEMLINERTDLAGKPVGDLVTLDLIYELVEGNLSSEKRKDIADITGGFPNTPWPAKVAKAIALLEFVRDLPRSEANLAALLYPRLGAAPVRSEVAGALDALERHQFIRRAEDGFKLQTQQEKSWETARVSHEPTLRDRHQLLRETIRTVAEDRISPYRHKEGRAFKVDLTVDGQPLGSGGQIPLDFRLADDAEEARELTTRTTTESRESANQNRVFWVVTLGNAVQDLLVDDLRSARMIAKYEQLRASEGIDPQVSAMLADEKQRQLDLERRLQEALADTLASGEVIFRGVTWDGSALGDNLSRAVNALLDRTVPELYPKLEMGARTVTGKEAEEILKAANLNALPQVYYDPPMGLGLVRSDAAGRKAIDEEAEIAREVLAYLRQQHSYGEKVTGRLLENHFTGLGYGWNPDVLHIVLAALLRAGAIEVSYQGRRYRNHIDPLVRQPFSGTQAFRSAGFAPREKVDLKSLVRAAENLESLTGEDVDIEEEAIAGRLKALARQELEGIGPALARINANKLPRSEVLTEYRDALRAIVEAAPDDCVRTLAGEGKTLRDERDQVRAIEDAVSDAELPKLLGASRALHELLPELRRRGLSAEVAEAGGRLEALFNGGEVYSRPGELVGLALRIRGAYEQLYANLHAERLQVYEAAIQELAERPEWRELEGLDDDSRLATLREAILADLKRRACDSRAINPETERCRACHAGLGQLESDIEAIGGLRQRALEQLWKAVEPEAPDTPSKRLRAVDYVHGPIASEEDLNAFLERLKAEIIAALRAGGRVILE